MRKLILAGMLLFPLGIFAQSREKAEDIQPSTSIEDLEKNIERLQNTLVNSQKEYTRQNAEERKATEAKQAEEQARVSERIKKMQDELVTARQKATERDEALAASGRKNTLLIASGIALLFLLVLAGILMLRKPPVRKADASALLVNPHLFELRQQCRDRQVKTIDFRFYLTKEKRYFVCTAVFQKEDVDHGAAYVLFKDDPDGKYLPWDRNRLVNYALTLMTETKTAKTLSR